MKPKTLISVIAALLSCASQAKAQSNFANVLSGYNAARDSPAVQAEGSVRMPHGSLYGVFYLDGSDSDKRMPDKRKPGEFYTELRLTYALENLYSRLKNLGAAAELNGGNHFDDKLRLGLTYEGSITDGNHTAIKFLPFNAGPDKEVQISIFTSQDIWRLKLSALFDYNFKSDNDTYYFEPQLDFRLKKWLMLFAQARASQTEGENKDKKRKLESLVGIKIPLN